LAVFKTKGVDVKSSEAKEIKRKSARASKGTHSQTWVKTNIDPLYHDPLQVATSSLLLSRMLLHTQLAWTPELQRCSGYSMEELIPCVVAVAETHSRCVCDSELLALAFKYSRKRRLCVSTLSACPTPEEIYHLKSHAAAK
jgi:hypothetical protein